MVKKAGGLLYSDAPTPDILNMQFHSVFKSIPIHGQITGNANIVGKLLKGLNI